MVEYSLNPFSESGGWFPYTFTPAANPGVVASNIPDSNTKSFYGALPAESKSKGR
jgi:hypothetical protein